MMQISTQTATKQRLSTARLPPRLVPKSLLSLHIPTGALTQGYNFITAQDHWDSLCKRHEEKTSAVGELSSLVANFGDDVKGVADQVDGVVVSPESLQGGEKKLDRLLQDVAAMTTYLEELEGKLQCAEEDLGAENFHPTRVSSSCSLSVVVCLF